MKSTTAYRPYPAQVKTESAASIFSKPTETHKPLDILYIQAMDTDHEDWKINTRKTLEKSSKDGAVNSGEISVKDLEGDDPTEKFYSFTRMLSGLRSQGILNDSTQVILSFKPGEQQNMLDISRGEFEGAWDVEKVLQAVRGEIDDSDGETNREFNGTIHLFGFDPNEFGSDALKRDGNLLLHASGKFNWDYKHDEIIKCVINNAKAIKNDDPEVRTKSIRDVLQRHAGYPIIRAGRERVTIKYPTFKSSKRLGIYKKEIERHQDPVNMFISSIERDSLDTIKKRMQAGLRSGVLGNLSEGKFQSKKDNTRLLVALAATNKDQKQKLDYLRTEIGISIKNDDLYKTGSLCLVLDKKRKSIDDGVHQYIFNVANEEVLTKDLCIDFLEKRISSNIPGALDSALKIKSIKNAIQNLDGDRIAHLLIKILETEADIDKEDIISRLISMGLKINRLSNQKRISLTGSINLLNYPEKIKIFDLFHNKDLDLKKNMGHVEKIKYQIFSKIPGSSDSIKNELQKLISDAKSDPSEKVKLDEIVSAAFGIANHHSFPNLDAMEFILNCGLDPNYACNNKWPLLHIACKDVFSKDLTQLFLSHKANPKITVEPDKVDARRLFCTYSGSLSAKDSLDVLDLMIDRHDDENHDELNILIIHAAHGFNYKLLEKLIINHPVDDDDIATAILDVIFEGAEKEGVQININEFENTLRVFWDRVNIDLSKKQLSGYQKRLNNLPNYKGIDILQLKKRLLGNKNKNVIVV